MFAVWELTRGAATDFVPACTRLRLDRVSVRGLPDGSVRVTKVGEWTSVRVNG
jgi:hypothetical protein